MDTQKLGDAALEAFQLEMRTAPDHSPLLSRTYVSVVDAWGCVQTFARCTADVVERDRLAVWPVDSDASIRLYQPGTWREATVADGYGPIAHFTPEGPIEPLHTKEAV